ncbi:MAG: TlyA family RNA methyltransferase [Ruminococcaceae bacterium]|nr:TlyA family RNA methyltransferase [Oscillospiraceae bacterium]
MRLDLYLTENGYAASRQRAKVLIDAGQVYIDGVQRTKASFSVPDRADIRVEIRGEVMPYVGRGGYKMAGALDGFDVNPAGFVCVDIGASTGGFTDCLLQRGAVKVYAVDSGSDQLAQSLRDDDRVVVMEQFNARALDETHTGGRVDLCVCDVSFISLTKIFEPVTRVLCDYHPQTRAGSFLALIKPQFEAGKEYIGKGGIVRDKKVYLRVITDLIRAAEEMGLYCVSVIPSPILGGDGNREFLAHFACRAPSAANRALLDRNCLLNIISGD